MAPGAGGKIIVIGGGLVGVCTAYYLSKMGRQVTLLEQRGIASGASGRNGGMIMKIDGRDTDPSEIIKRWPYVRENDRLLNGLVEEFDDDFGIMRRGSLDIAFTDGEVDLLRRLTKMQRQETGDDEIQYLDGRDLRELSPLIDKKCLGARYRPSDGCLFPFRLVNAMCRKAAEMGAEILSWTKGEEILFSNGRVTGVRTPGEIIDTEAVVVAANAWSSCLVPEIPIVPLRSLAVLTEPVPPVPVMTFEAELKGKIIYGCTQTERGNILVGGPPEKPAARDSQFDEGVSLEEMRVNSSIIPELFPQLRNVNIIRTWAGTMGATPDGLPCVGAVGKYDGLYMAAGYSNGMSWGVVTGKLLAERIVEKESSIPLNTLDPNRFEKMVFNWPETYDYTILADYLGRAG